MAEAGCLQTPCTSPHEGQFCPHKRPQGQWRGTLGGAWQGGTRPSIQSCRKITENNFPGAMLPIYSSGTHWAPSGSRVVSAFGCGIDQSPFLKFHPFVQTYFFFFFFFGICDNADGPWRHHAKCNVCQRNTICHMLTYMWITTDL